MNARARFGIDAPGMVRANFALGALLVLAAAAGQPLLDASPIPPRLSFGAAIGGGLFVLLGTVMLWSSLVGKKRVCDRLVKSLALSGNERVLDAGCGRGLALITCAKHLSAGRAVGVDLWAASDLSNNTPEAALANAAAEGVADRIEIRTGDITRLEFPDASFDAVISMTVLHNIPSRLARDEALREFVRVLKPGGRLAIFDLLHTSHYAAVLQAANMTVSEVGHERLWLLSRRSLIAQKPTREETAP